MKRRRSKHKGGWPELTGVDLNNKANSVAEWRGTAGVVARVLQDQVTEHIPNPRIEDPFVGHLWQSGVEPGSEAGLGRVNETDEEEKSEEQWGWEQETEEDYGEVRLNEA